MIEKWTTYKLLLCTYKNKENLEKYTVVKKKATKAVSEAKYEAFECLYQ